MGLRLYRGGSRGVSPAPQAGTGCSATAVTVVRAGRLCRRGATSRRRPMLRTACVSSLRWRARSIWRRLRRRRVRCPLRPRAVVSPAGRAWSRSLAPGPSRREGWARLAVHLAKELVVGGERAARAQARDHLFSAMRFACAAMVRADQRIARLRVTIEAPPRRTTAHATLSRWTRPPSAGNRRATGHRQRLTPRSPCLLARGAHTATQT